MNTPWVNKDHQSRATLLLRDAVREIGLDNVKLMLSMPMRLWGSDHDTGCQWHIDIQSADVPPLRLWEGSVWYSYAYEFNDRDKTLGINPECRFAEEKLSEFFEKVEAALIDGRTAKLCCDEQAKRDCEDQRRSALAHYRQMFETEGGVK